MKASARDPTGSVRSTLADGRFEIRGCFGSGSNGTVYEAFDRSQGSTVAVKVLGRGHGEAVLRLKREFRALHDFHHRNLVQLRELLCSDGQWLLVMEVIEGTDLLSYVRKPHTGLGDTQPIVAGQMARPDADSLVDFERLRACLLQLVQGLDALHAAGMVHRDIKPSNIRVTPSGRLVILDFGLVKSGTDSLQISIGEVMGTVAYMAPEQAASEELSSASDWYAVGVMLFEALTGMLPVDGSTLHILLEKQRDVRHSPSEHVSGVPPSLDKLCTALLERGPKRRAGSEQVMAAMSLLRPTGAVVEPLSPFAHERPSTLRTRNSEIFGREEEMARLEAAFARSRLGSLSTVLLTGESGIGKSRLLAHFCEYVAVDHQALVLSSRCRESETLAYKAVGGLVDALSQHLLQLSPEACRVLLPPHAGLLPLVFPVLGRVRAITEASASSKGAQDRLALRALVFTALRELLIRVSDSIPTVIAIDDFQWADGESLALLAELIRGPTPPRILLLIATRGLEVGDPSIRSSIDETLDAAEHSTAISLTPLPVAVAQTLAARLAGGDSERASELVRESAGHPLLLEFLAQHSADLPGGQASFANCIQLMLQRLEPLQRELLDLWCIAGAPMPRSVLLDMELHAGQAQIDAALATLRTARLVSMLVAGGVTSVEPCHDRIRAAVVEQISPERRVALHQILAMALGRCVGVDRARVAHHFAEAGYPQRAAVHALLAGDQANESLAFAKAARMYRWALTLDAEVRSNRSVLLKLADALGNAGECSSAADVLLSTVANADPSEALDVRRRAAELLIQSGRVAEGMEVAGALMQTIGLSLPRSTAEALRLAAWYRLRLLMRGENVRIQRASQVHHEELLRIDLLATIAAALGPVRSVTTLALQSEHFLRALDAGEPSRVALAMVHDAIGFYFRGKYEGIRPRLARAAELLADCDRPDVEAVLHFANHFAAQAEQDSLGAMRALEQALRVLNERCVGQSWLRDTTRSTLLRVAVTRGDYQLVLEHFPAMMRELSERQDPFARVQNLTAAAFPYYLCAGRLDLAERALEQVDERDMGPPMESTVASARLQLDWLMAKNEGITKFLAWRLTFMRKHAWITEPTLSPTHAIAALLNAELHRRAGGGTSGPFLREACKIRKLVAQRRKAQASHRFGELLDAVLADVVGDREGALRAYQVVEENAVARNMGSALLAVAQTRRGQLLGGEEGRSMVKAALDHIASTGVKRPVLILDAQFPGVLDRADPALLSYR